MVKITARFLLLTGIVGVLVPAGCGRKASVEPTMQSKAFDSAPPGIKQAWGAVVSGLQTNDFGASSQVALWDLRRQPELTDQQKAVVEKTLKTLSSRMFEAAGRGDPAALKAMKQVRERSTDDK